MIVLHVTRVQVTGPIDSFQMIISSQCILDNFRNNRKNTYIVFIWLFPHFFTAFGLPSAVIVFPPEGNLLIVVKGVCLQQICLPLKRKAFKNLLRMFLLICRVLG